MILTVGVVDRYVKEIPCLMYDRLTKVQAEHHEFDPTADAKVITSFSILIFRQPALFLQNFARGCGAKRFWAMIRESCKKLDIPIHLETLINCTECGQSSQAKFDRMGNTNIGSWNSSPTVVFIGLLTSRMKSKDMRSPLPNLLEGTFAK